MGENEKDKLQPTSKDWIHTLTKAGLSAIPVVGGPAAELFSAIIIPPLSKRRDEWIESIAEGLKQLQDKYAGFNIEDLQQNETFITTAMHATQAAIRNHQKEKKEALRNAVLNSALPNDPDGDIQLIFIQLVDSITPWHLRILKHINDSSRGLEYTDDTGSLNQHGPSRAIPQSIVSAFPELKAYRLLSAQVLEDLDARGLTSTKLIKYDERAKRSYFRTVATDLAREFICFVTSPLDEAKTGKEEDSGRKFIKLVFDTLVSMWGEEGKHIESKALFTRLWDQQVEIPDYAMHNALKYLKEQGCIRGAGYIGRQAVRQHGAMTITWVNPGCIV